MLPIKFRCYKCEKPIGAKPGKEGRVVRCPHCDCRLVVPELPKAEPAPLTGLTDNSTFVDISYLDRKP